MSIFSKKKKAEEPQTATRKHDRELIRRVIERNESITRKDIADWKKARIQATSTLEPRQTLLQGLYEEIMLDALITSQVGLRIDKSQGIDFSLKRDDKDDEEATKKLRDSGLFDTLSELIIESKFYCNSLVEFSYDKTGIQADLVPRKNVSPKTGRFYPDIYSGAYVEYRKEPDFGKWIIEFYPRKGDLGILNKAVPYVLMKKFALSCWSELCEIFGIPPRVLKTNTTDPEMMNRAETMMREIGSAAYFIIDTEEQFEFAQASSTNGDIYKNLISTCDQQISLLVLAAVLGQDTVNGNRSKEESSSKLLDSVVKADNRYIEACFNKIVLPALAAIGFLPDGLRLEIAKEVDIDKLWKMVYEGSQYYEFDTEWIRDTFGIEVVGAKQLAPDPEPPAPKRGAKKEEKTDDGKEERQRALEDFFL